MVATSRLYVTVPYGSCVVASDLYSTVSYGGAVQTPGAMCTCRGCTIFFFFFFFFFLSTLGRTNVFFVQEHILAKFGAFRARSFNSRDRSLEGIDIVICMGVLACACERG